MSRLAKISALVVVAAVSCNPSKTKDAPVWDGKSPFACDGDRIVTLQGMKVSSVDGMYLVTAGGNCQLTLVDCELEADNVLRVNNQARVVIERGRFEAPSSAPNRTVIQVHDDASLTVRGASIAGKTGIQVMGNARVVVESGTVRGSEHAIGAWGTSKLKVEPGTKVEGDVYYDTHVQFTGPPELRMDETRTLVTSISPACGMVEHCYTAAKQFGRIGGRVSVQVDARGRVGSVNVDRGEVPADVRSCLEKYQGKLLDGAGGRAGTLRCEYDGRFVEGGQGSMHWWPKFVATGVGSPDAAAAAAASAR